MIAHGERERQGVFYHYRITADVSLAADATELMHARIGADVRSVGDDDMAGEGRSIRHDYLIAKQAIMRDVRLRHDEAVIAGFGDPTTARGATMNRHELADPIAPANFSFRRLAGKLQILRRQTNRDKRENLRFVANPGAAVDDTMAVDLHSFAQYHVI